MSEKKTIKEAVRRKFPVINFEDNLRTAIGLMATANVSVLVVKLGEEIIGLVTVSDVMWSLARRDDPDRTLISTFMTKCEFDTRRQTRNPCLQLDENEDAINAIKVMYESGVNHLLVSGSTGEPVGIVSSLELVKLMADQSEIA